jgi:hypothetical protein
LDALLLDQMAERNPERPTSSPNPRSALEVAKPLRRATGYSQ